MYFITGNRGKFEEAKAILGDLEQLDIDLPEIQEIDTKKILEFKLKEAQKHHDGELIVDDTSIYFDCLNGLPGPLVKWFLKTIGNDGLHKIADSYNNYRAEARTTLGYIHSNGETHFFEGVIEGQIVEPRGNKGFGWDPVFQPKGYDKTFAEMGAKEKNKISMRKLALVKLRDFLDNGPEFE